MVGGKGRLNFLYVRNWVFVVVLMLILVALIARIVHRDLIARMLPKPAVPAPAPSPPTPAPASEKPYQSG